MKPKGTPVISKPRPPTKDIGMVSRIIAARR